MPVFNEAPGFSRGEHVTTLLAPAVELGGLFD
jgi:hypothetical protein